MDKACKTILPISSGNDPVRKRRAEEIATSLDSIRRNLVRTVMQDECRYINRPHDHSFDSLCLYCVVHQPWVDSVSSDVLYSLLSHSDLLHDDDTLFDEDDTLPIDELAIAKKDRAKLSALQRLRIEDLTLQLVYGRTYPEMLSALYLIQHRMDVSTRGAFLRELLFRLERIHEQNLLPHALPHDRSPQIIRIVSLILKDLGIRGGLKSDARRDVERGLLWFVLARLSEPSLSVPFKTIFLSEATKLKTA